MNSFYNGLDTVKLVIDHYLWVQFRLLLQESEASTKRFCFKPQVIFKIMIILISMEGNFTENGNEVKVV